VAAAMGKYKDHWHRYNPRKAHIARFGLSLTSLEGGLTGLPDLDSLKEYNKENGTHYDEENFRTPTPVLRDNEAIRQPIEKFIPLLGRSHFIRLDEGGFFPFHRDSSFPGAKTFRLFAPLLGCEAGQFVFLYDGQRIFLEPGQLYFINTKVEHALFSFGKDATFLVLNVVVSEESVGLVIESLLAR
jgi:hypothetical protein